MSENQSVSPSNLRMKPRMTISLKLVPLTNLAQVVDLPTVVTLLVSARSKSKHRRERETHTWKHDDSFLFTFWNGQSSATR